jgi:hypothetical protein
MPVFDAERAWLRLKAEIAKKGSHGQRDLLAEMGRIEVECALDDHERNFEGGQVVRPLESRGAA